MVLRKVEVHNAQMLVAIFLASAMVFRPKGSVFEVAHAICR
jgi:hypothetical protein